MKKRTLLSLLLALVFFAGIAGAGYYFLLVSQVDQHNPVAAASDTLFGWKFPVAKFPSTGSVGRALAYSDIRDPGGVPQGLPVRLQIPVIGVDSAIEDALITHDGRMDVPAGSVNVAWFALGPHPGQVGSAVIGGHFGIKNGVPFVFYNLDKLKIGDKVYIVDDEGNTLGFAVRSIKSFDRNADATTVFTSGDGLAHLNLITCEGIWNQVNGTYPQRLVLFTDAILPVRAATGSVPVFGRSLSAEAMYDFVRPLGIGTSGKDVAALQTILEQKGFLTMPPGLAKGYFGPRTRDAVAKYQTNIDLPAVGIFDSLTRARLILELTPVAVKPRLPSTAITSPESSPSHQILMRSAESVYATPLDALITSFLLVSIVFVAFKIIRFGKRPRSVVAYTERN